MDYLDPATGRKIGEIVPNSNEDVVSAYSKASVAWSVWKLTSLEERLQYLVRGQKWLIENMDDVIDVISLNNGKPKTESMMADIAPVIWAINYFNAEAPRILKSKSISVSRWVYWKRAVHHYLPLGVVGIISPWNYPFSIPMGEVLTALVAGNCVLLKPSEVTSGVNQMIRRFFEACQLPSGVFQILEGDGSVGATLTKQKLAKIVFTGSVPTGKKIMQTAAENLIPVSLELGGKDPAIILDDANIEVATSGIVVGGFFNNGQTCCSIERLLVHESISEVFLKKLNSKLAKLRVGASTTHSNDIGPLTYEAQKTVLKRQFQDLGSPQSELYDGKANFLIPTLIHAKPGSKIWDEGSFGPVLVYDTFKTDEEAIEKANKTDFGLAAVIWSGNKSRAQNLAKKIQVGTVVINDAPHTHAIFSLPWGGVKNSGIGRVHGEVGLRDMCHNQIVTYDIFGQWKQPWWFPYSENHFILLKSFTLFLASTSVFKKAKYFCAVVMGYLKVEKRL